MEPARCCFRPARCCFRPAHANQSQDTCYGNLNYNRTTSYSHQNYQLIMSMKPIFITIEINLAHFTQNWNVIMSMTLIITLSAFWLGRLSWHEHHEIHGRKVPTLLLSLRAVASGLHMQINRKTQAMGTWTTIEPQTIAVKIIRWSDQWNPSLANLRSESIGCN